MCIIRFYLEGIICRIPIFCAYFRVEVGEKVKNIVKKLCSPIEMIGKLWYNRYKLIWKVQKMQGVKLICIFFYKLQGDW